VWGIQHATDGLGTIAVHVPPLQHSTPEINVVHIFVNLLSLIGLELPWEYVFVGLNRIRIPRARAITVRYFFSLYFV